jgi:nucleotide-binding universal stress UspA family protein
MRILIAYDSSIFADAALDDLQRAGLPAEADCMVVSIADVWPPPPPGTEGDDLVYAALDQRGRARVLELRNAAKSMLAEAGVKAAHATRIVQSRFPGWTLQSEATADSPAWGIVKRANEWRANLVVVGSHGMSVTERLFIGSVSQRVMTHAPCSVRVARSSPDSNSVPTRLIIGFDGSRDAEAAVREVRSRSWPDGTEIRIVTAVDQRMMAALAARVLRPRPLPKPGEKVAYQDWLSTMTEEAAEQLRAVQLRTTCSLADGEPKQILIEAAKAWRAHCIFLGATGLRGLRKVLLGSVSSAVTAHAPCTVEVVRPGAYVADDYLNTGPSS